MKAGVLKTCKISNNLTILVLSLFKHNRSFHIDLHSYEAQGVSYLLNNCDKFD